MNSRKKFFADDVLQTSKALVSIVDSVHKFIDEGIDCDYQLGGMNEFTDEDLSRYEITATEFYDVSSVLNQLQRLADGLSTSPGDYMSALNKIRRVVI